jgi:hypothetical protein
MKKVRKEPRFLPATDEPPPESASLQKLVGTIRTREWLRVTLEELEFVIMDLDAELHENEHILKCKRCQIELQLSVERYLGSRGPWWIDVMNGELFEEHWEDVPKAENYEIGWYGHSSEDTIRFIKDRCKWASIQSEKRFKAACQLISQLENYDVKEGIPEVSWIEGMIELVIEEKKNS